MTSSILSSLNDQRKAPTTSAAAKVSSHWKLLKTLINTDEVEEDNDDKNRKKVVERSPQVISHGVHHIGQINTRNINDKALKFVAYNPATKNYATISDEGNVTVFSPNGQSKQIKSKERYKGIIFATKMKQWVCWCPSGKLKLMSDSFKPISTSQSVAEINCAVYNKSTHEVITAGDGNITCWSFRYGGKYLTARKVITEQLENCVISGMCLEDSLSKTQRCFVSIGSSIATFDLLESKCLAFHKSRHAREITSLIFFNPLKFLITAAKDGSIKVWNDEGSLEISFVGHHGSVNALASYPFGHFIMSASNDMTLRVWSLEAKDEVDKMHCKSPVDGLGTIVSNDHLYSFSTEGIDLWKIKHIHTACTIVGCKVKSAKQTTHPKVPLRIICICADATVRIISGSTGQVLTTSLVPDLTTIADAVYSAADGLLFTLLVNGRILKSSTLTNPCTLQQVWDVKGGQRPCTCLCLYEYIVEDMMAGDSWKQLVRAATNQQGEMNDQYVPGRNDRTLLLGGCVNGYIVVFDWQDKKHPGKVSFEIEAHRDEVVSMISNPKIDQVISSGLDNVIKIWRLFPFAEEALAPLMTLYFDEQPRHLCSSHHRLLVGLYDRSHANYSITVYKTTRKDRFDHPADHDHSDEVIAVASCPKMRIFASASLDGTVRIWDESCRLRQIMKLNATPTSLCFCSERGDLIVAIGDSLHKIKYATYMPKTYVFRMVAMDFSDVGKDPAIPLDEKIFSSLSSVDKQRVTRARSLLAQFTRPTESSALDKFAETEEQAKNRALALEKIKERENDLKKLRDGELHSSKKKPKMDDKLLDEAFEKYISIVHKRTPFSMPEDFDEQNETAGYNEEDVYIPDRLATGFFAIDPRAKTQDKASDSEEKPVDEGHEETDASNRQRSQSLPFINEPDIYSEYRNTKLALEDTSVELSYEKTIVQDLVQNEVPSKKKKKTRLKCVHRLRKGIVVGKTPGNYPFPTKPLLDVSRDTELAMVEDESGEQYEALVIAPDGFIPNSVVVALFADMRQKDLEKAQHPQENTIPWRPPQLTEAQLLEITTRKVPSPDISEEIVAETTVNRDYEDRLRYILQASPVSDTIEKESVESVTFEADEPPQEQKLPPPLPRVSSMDVPLKRPILKPLEKPSVAKTESLLSIESHSPMEEFPDAVITPPLLTPTPPPVVEERPLTPLPPLPHFIIQFQGMRWFDKIFPKANPRTFPKPWTVNAFVELLLIFFSKASDYATKHHITAAIMVLYGQEGFDSNCSKNVCDSVISELNLPSGPSSSWDSDQKQFIRTALKLLNNLSKTSSALAELMLYFILGDKEIRSFTLEIFDDIGVQDAERYFFPELDDFDTWGVPETSVKTRVHSLCVSWLDKWLSQFKDHIRSFAGKIDRASSGHVIRGTKSAKTPSPVKGILKSKESQHKRKHEVSWSFNTMGEKAADSAGYVDAINYFSEMQLQSEIEKARARRHSVKKEESEDEKVRNTVLILPDIKTKPSLARLGETHCSHCHPERETALTGFVLPPIKQRSSFVRNIALRLNTLTLNPFPEDNDLHIYEAFQQHNLLTLRSSQKYFFPSHSYVQTESVK